LSETSVCPLRPDGKCKADCVLNDVDYGDCLLKVFLKTGIECFESLRDKIQKEIEEE
jgi:hypothetical protein